jgi:hypothetical protein
MRGDIPVSEEPRQKLGGVTCNLCRSPNYDDGTDPRPAELFNNLSRPRRSPVVNRRIQVQKGQAARSASEIPVLNRRARLLA